MKVLILGHNGMLGNAVHKHLERIFEVQIISNQRWDSIEFRNSVLQSDAEFIINCIGAIPQKKYEEEYYKDINVNLPEFLETTGKKILHPSTDCEFSGKLKYPNKYGKNDIRDAEDDYGKSKAEISGKIINEFKNTKIIRTSIIGHEISEKKYSLLDWFLSVEDGSEVNGFSNHYWNGITTLEWAKIAEDFIINWDRYNTLNQVGTDGLNKYELLNMFNEIYDKNVIINSFEPEKSANKMLVSDYDLPSLEQQIIELKQFYEK